MGETFLFEARVRGGPPLRATLASYAGPFAGLLFLAFLHSIPLIVGLGAVVAEGFTPEWSARSTPFVVEVRVDGRSATRSTGGGTFYPHPLAPIPSPLAAFPGAPATVPLAGVVLALLGLNEAARVARWRSTRYLLGQAQWITRRGVLFPSETRTPLGGIERVDRGGPVARLVGLGHPPIDLEGLDGADAEALDAALRRRGA